MRITATLLNARLETLNEKTTNGLRYQLGWAYGGVMLFSYTLTKKDDLVEITDRMTKREMGYFLGGMLHVLIGR